MKTPQHSVSAATEPVYCVERSDTWTVLSFYSVFHGNTLCVILHSGRINGRHGTDDDNSRAVITKDIFRIEIHGLILTIVLC